MQHLDPMTLYTLTGQFIRYSRGITKTTVHSKLGSIHQIHQEVDKPIQEISKTATKYATVFLTWLQTAHERAVTLL